MLEFLKDFENADTISIDTLALEEMLQDERAKEISQLNLLSKRVCYLHTSLLYYRNPKSKMGSACYEAWRTLVKWAGGSPNTWKDLGCALGIVQADLDYITNAVKEDPADVVLKVFMQNEKATLDKILDAFVKMKRYDILKALEDPLSDLAQLFHKDDSGYHSNNTKEIISYTKDLPNDLPPALNKKYVLRPKEPNRSKQPVMKPLPKTDDESEKSDGPVLFLSYAEDGIPTAYNIKHYVSNWTDIPNVKVITLNDKREEVFQNPEKFIREYLEKGMAQRRRRTFCPRKPRESERRESADYKYEREIRKDRRQKVRRLRCTYRYANYNHVFVSIFQADYVVPILTAGYMQEIRSHNPTMCNTSDNLDCKYVNFIYNLTINYYIHASGCMNTKVRSVLPQNSVSVLRDIAMYPDLMPWTPENDFDEQFKAFLNKDYS